MVKLASAQHPPLMAAPTLSAVARPAAPPTPTPVAQPTPPKIPHVTLDTVPLTSATELTDSPKLAAYNTSGRSFQPVHPPSPPAAAKPSAPVLAANATPAPPPPPARVNPGGGVDSRNLVVVNAVEVHSEIAQIPPAEIHGRFEVTADPDFAEGHSTGGSSSSAGVNGNGLASTGSGAGKGPANSASNTGAGAAAAHGKGSTGNGRSNIASAGHAAGRGPGSRADAGAGAGHGTAHASGAGAGAGNGAGLAGNGSSPFSGMTIVGGTVSGATGAPASIAVKSGPGPPGSYGMTIVSSGSSGGGLRDYGVFNDGPVFTVYLDVSKLGIHGMRWSLQYSASRDVRIAHAGYVLTPPFPQTQILPLLPPPLVATNVGRLFVFQATLKADGKLDGFHVLETPDARINDPILASLTKWTFQPASMGNDKVPIKVLMGIPIASAMADTGVSQQAGAHPPADAALHTDAQ
jgi:hypothetical protein